MRCDQCEALMINGVFCHETGCPNTRKQYDENDDVWREYYDCRECGSSVEVGESCSCYDEPLDMDEFLASDRYNPEEA